MHLLIPKGEKTGYAAHMGEAKAKWKLDFEEKTWQSGSRNQSVCEH
jgi:hypothetical protein